MCSSSLLEFLNDVFFGWNSKFQQVEKSKVSFVILEIPTFLAILDVQVEMRIQNFHLGDNFWRIYNLSRQELLEFL